MTKQTRRKFTAEFKAKVVLETLKNQKTLAQLSQQYEVNVITISKWKADFLANMASVFERNGTSHEFEESPEMDKLYAQIGQLKVENDFLKKSAKKLGISDSEWK
jgi:transposase-like protein